MKQQLKHIIYFIDYYCNSNPEFKKLSNLKHILITISYSSQSIISLIILQHLVIVFFRNLRYLVLKVIFIKLIIKNIGFWRGYGANTAVPATSPASTSTIAVL